MGKARSKLATSPHLIVLAAALGGPFAVVVVCPSLQLLFSWPPPWSRLVFFASFFLYEAIAVVAFLAVLGWAGLVSHGYRVGLGRALGVYLRPYLTAAGVVLMISLVGGFTPYDSLFLMLGLYLRVTGLLYAAVIAPVKLARETVGGGASGLGAYVAALTLVLMSILVGFGAALVVRAGDVLLWSCGPGPAVEAIYRLPGSKLYVTASMLAGRLALAGFYMLLFPAVYGGGSRTSAA